MINSSEQMGRQSGRRELDPKRVDVTPAPGDPLTDLWKISSPSQRLELLRHVLPVLAPEDLVDTADQQRPQRAPRRAWLPVLIGLPIAIIGLSWGGLWLGLRVPLDLPPASASPQPATPPALAIRVAEPERTNPSAMEPGVTAKPQVGAANHSVVPANGPSLRAQTATLAAPDRPANGKSFWTKPR
ncbi:MAG TPA: hypothetical protein VJV79_27610 [Polyangiaceae bacterium]|nr:hypothetical protein [Polyangiaceae bacterium]